MYRRQIETFIRAHNTHITKTEFFIAFNMAYIQSKSILNAKAGFRGAGLVPFDPQIIFSKLDIRIRTPTKPPLCRQCMVSQTPHNPIQALSQISSVKDRTAAHQGSSPTSILQTVTALAKGTEILAHKMTLLTAEVQTLRKANEALNKRRRAKNTRIQQGGVLTIEEGTDILARKDAMKEVEANRHVERGNKCRSTKYATLWFLQKDWSQCPNLSKGFRNG